ncbi:hypothetical protein BGP77_16755 [Saccharospirillum sp. MSK14-1]|uniref:TetR/AcrR family transcriptional regulator n=1 Tax=Saccharospirillum sp. MSK14-1 TaxID=1897632 RepID=UPI000D34032F|nr:helix-turn-helix domain-containing protein [Saccharospirillum sp. MSK14-1]PTY38098.1 hypothetical protein BGP77_16755 [Saccharospirillum sp. MSK14-1]
MPRQREFNETDVLEQALPVFWKSGYSATSIGDIVHASGVSRYGLYSAFGEKHHLFAQVMDHYSRKNITFMLGPMERDGAGMESIERYFDILTETIPSHDKRLGCLIGNASIELVKPHEQIAERISTHFERMRAAFENALTGAYAQRTDVLPRVPELADYLVGVAMGYLLCSKAGFSEEHIRRFVETSIELLP